MGENKIDDYIQCIGINFESEYTPKVRAQDYSFSFN